MRDAHRDAAYTRDHRARHKQRPPPGSVPVGLHLPPISFHHIDADAPVVHYNYLLRSLVGVGPELPGKAENVRGQDQPVGLAQKVNAEEGAAEAGATGAGREGMNVE